MQNSPKFHDFLRLLKSKHASKKMEAYFLLLPYVNEFIPELKQAFENETDKLSKVYFIQLLEETKSAQLLDFFNENLKNKEEPIRTCAIHGLKKINNKAARKLLWEAQSYHLSDLEEDKRFHQELCTKADQSPNIS